MNPIDKWRTYQRERFPALAHGALILAFSSCAVSYSALLRAAPLPGGARFLTAFVVSFLSFLLLRIADEFKDAEEDARWRPYRAVPRGLVTLRELGWLGVGAGLIQLGLALWLSPRLVVLLLITWGYLALMSVEFFAREWLKARPFTYLWTHMMIMPLIDLFATGCDWMPATGAIPRGLAWFLVVSYFNGVVIEIGRKIRAPQDEEKGVDSYTAVWGRDGAMAAWLAALALSAVSAFFAAAVIRRALPVSILLVAAFAAAGAAALRFRRDPSSRNAKFIETASGLWIIVLYLALGALPHL